MTSLSTAGARTSAANRCAIGIVILLLLVIGADWLFYKQRIGVSAALFLLCIAAGVLIANPVRASPRTSIIAGGILAAALIPLCMRFSAPALLFGAMGLAVFAVMLLRPAAHWIFAIGEALLVLIGCVWRALIDIAGFLNASLSGERAPLYKSAALTWIIPLCLGGLFLLLFTAANPLIEDWLALLNPRAVSQIDLLRILFWLAVVSLAWPFVFISRRHALPSRTKPELEAAFDRSYTDLLPQSVFNDASILRSLIVFNALFAVQTALDLAYLWGGVSLPAGMSYATYAHRGAYPLLIAALLAAAFVLIAMRPGSESERSPLIRKLVYLWIAQTLLLVMSSILRLDLYVAAYSLTYLRLAAFVWMILVAIGLMLIAARIMLARSNLWLIGGNAIALALAVYVWSIANVPALIAHYNVMHSRELSGEGVMLDVGYLAQLGPQAIPALDLYLARQQGSAATAQAQDTRQGLALRYRYLNNWQPLGWRAWTFWNWRLSEYLQQHPGNLP